ncbi:MAG: hypothetical protein ACI4TK_10295, partial [Agathobacter sp.]
MKHLKGILKSVFPLMLILMLFCLQSTKCNSASAPVILEQPQSYEGSYGDNVTLVIKASGSNLRYQWQYYIPSYYRWVNISGEKADTLTFVFSSEYEGIQIRCVVTNSANLSTISETATIRKSATAGEGAEAEDPAEESTEAEDPEEDSTEAEDPAEDSTEAEDPAEEGTEAEDSDETQIPGDIPAKSVTPEMFGAKGDGKTDDTEAIQKAIDSGYNVVFGDKTYFIAANKYLTISNKTDFHMYGGTIHKAASANNIQLFVLTDCTNCSFENMYIYSEFAYKDILIPADHTRPSPQLSSNVLAFSGKGNTNITFKNNSFDYMSADYWLNGKDNAFWKDIVVDGWESSTSLMPMYAQCITGLTVKNADVALNPESSGDGDHCIYVCYRGSDVKISDSHFYWNGSTSVSGRIAVLTFHGGSYNIGTQPRNITISNTTIEAKEGRAVYCSEGVDVTFRKCNISNTTKDKNGNVPLLFGYGDMLVYDSSLTTPDTVFDGLDSLYLENCNISGAAYNAITATLSNLTAVGCNITIGDGSLYYVTNAAGVNHTYQDC